MDSSASSIKKENSENVQQEPIFFAHAEKVGVDTKGKICENHLFNHGNDIISKYNEFKQAVLNSYDGNRFNPTKFKSQKYHSGELL